jgi:hypothetical protein
MEHRDIYQTGLQLWADWTRMWNGAPEHALELVAPRFVLHLTLPSAAAREIIVDLQTTEAWVRAHCAKFERLEFRFDCALSSTCVPV